MSSATIGVLFRKALAMVTGMNIRTCMHRTCNLKALAWLDNAAPTTWCLTLPRTVHRIVERWFDQRDRVDVGTSHHMTLNKAPTCAQKTDLERPST